MELYSPRTFLFIIYTMLLLGCVTTQKTTQKTNQNTVDLQISNFEITKKTGYVMTYQLDCKLSNFTKEAITILLPLQENDNKISQWHQPEFFSVKSTPNFGLEYLDGQPEHIHLKTKKEVLVVPSGESYSFKFYSNCDEINNIDGEFKGITNIILNYNFNSINKENTLKKLPKSSILGELLDNFSILSIQSNTLEIDLN